MGGRFLLFPVARETYRQCYLRLSSSSGDKSRRVSKTETLRYPLRLRAICRSDSCLPQPLAARAAAGCFDQSGGEAGYSCASERIAVSIETVGTGEMDEVIFLHGAADSQPNRHKTISAPSGQTFICQRHATLAGAEKSLDRGGKGRYKSWSTFEQEGRW